MIDKDVFASVCESIALQVDAVTMRMTESEAEEFDASLLATLVRCFSVEENHRHLLAKITEFLEAEERLINGHVESDDDFAKRFIS